MEMWLKDVKKPVLGPWIDIILWHILILSSTINYQDTRFLISSFQHSKISFTFSNQPSFFPFCRASILYSSLSGRRRDFHHIVFSGHDAAIPRYDDTGSEHPPKWSIPWRRRDSQHDRCIKRLLKQKKTKENIYFCITDIYIFMLLYINVWLYCI